jgi:autotransporter-associated beta strand protein
LTLTAANTYIGATNVLNGTLVLNGSHTPGTGAGLYTVSGGTLMGSGATNGDLSVLSGGTVAPGNSIESLGVGSISYDGGTFEYELDTTLLTADLLYGDDLSTLTLLNDPELDLIDLGGNSVVPLGTKFTLIAYDGAWNSGTFNGYADGSTFSFAGNTWLIDYNDPLAGINFTGDLTGLTAFVTITSTAAAVPEPGTLALGLAGLVGLTLWSLGANPKMPERRVGAISPWLAFRVGRRTPHPGGKLSPQ